VLRAFREPWGILGCLCLTLPLLLPGCTMVMAQANDSCAIVGYAIGRGMSTVTCTPSTKTIIIPPPTSSEVVYDPGIVWVDFDSEEPPEPIEIDEQVYQELINNICLTEGCTITETSATGIDVKGGPPDKNVVTGLFDMLFSVGSWFATKYFAAGF